jgi:hypothetical protein
MNLDHVAGRRLDVTLRTGLVFQKPTGDAQVVEKVAALG